MRGFPVFEPVRRIALQIHEALRSLTAPIGAEDFARVLSRDFPEIASEITVDMVEARAWLELLHTAGLASRDLDHESGATVYRAEKP